MITIHSPIYSHFPLRSTASPLDSHLSSSLLPQPSPHRHHVYRILLTAPLSSRAFPTSTFSPPHSCSHFYLSSALLLTPSTHLSVPLPSHTRLLAPLFYLPTPPRTALPCSLRASFSHQPRHFATPLLPRTFAPFQALTFSESPRTAFAVLASRFLAPSVLFFDTLPIGELYLPTISLDFRVVFRSRRVILPSITE